MTVVQRKQAERLKESLQVEAEMARQSLPIPRRPRTETPELRGDLTDLEDSALMDLLVLFTRWADFSGGQLAVADVDERFASAYVDQLKAIGLIESWGGEEEVGPRGGVRKRTVTEMRAAKQSEPMYREAIQAKLNAYARRKMLTAVHEAFERDAAVVSRELTRRLERSPSERRTARYGGAR